MQLQGDSSFVQDPSLTTISGTNYLARGQGILLDFGQFTRTMMDGDHLDGDCHKTPTTMVEFMSKFSDIFTFATRLPPARERDHAIILEEGTSTISVRPYRYP